MWSSLTSRTLETQGKTAISDLAAHAAGDADHAAGRHLRCASGIVGLLETARQRFHPDPTERFLERAQAAHGHRLAACHRWAGAGIKPLPYFYEPAFADELAQR